MCGRFVNTHTVAELARYFHAVLRAARVETRAPNDSWAQGEGLQRELFPDYNIAPRKRAAMVRLEESGQGREIQEAQWGLVPSWAKDPQFGSKTFNARSETVAEKPTFRSSFRKHRCLIPASGYYEWQKIGANKQPWYLHPSEVDRADEPFAFAGLWEPGADEKSAGGASEASGLAGASGASGMGEMTPTFTILTMDAPEHLVDIHARVPVVVERDLYDDWLDVTNPAEAVLQMVLQENPVRSFARRPVGKAVGNVRNNGPELLKEVPQA